MVARSETPARETYLLAHPGAELFGSDRMLLESARGIVDSGARAVVALPEHGPLVEHLRGAGAEVVILPMLVLRKALLRPRGWPTLIRNTLRGAGATWRLIGRVRPAAVYVSTITIPQWPLIARLRRVPVVSHVHEAEASGSRLINAALYAPHLAATSVLVNSRFSRDTIAAALPRAARRAELVFNGVAGPSEAALPREDIDELRVLYMGRLSPRKGVDDVVSAVSLLTERGQPATVSLLGSVFTGYEWYEQELRERAAELGGDTVRFLGFRPDVWSVLAEHDVLVVPSRIDEPFGNTAVEGILALRPVIASDTSGLREAAGGYPTAALVAPHAPTAIADALEDIVRTWADLRGRLEASRAQAEARHAPELYRRAVSDAMRSAGSAR